MEKVIIIAKINNTIVKNYINNPPLPLSQIQIVKNNNKVLGHQLSFSNNINHSIIGRLNRGKCIV